MNTGRTVADSWVASTARITAYSLAVLTGKAIATGRDVADNLRWNGGRANADSLGLSTRIAITGIKPRDEY